MFFKSVSERLKTENILSIIMTGMGKDGADGVGYLKSAKCYSITQEKKSCVVYGMPKAVVERDFSDKELKPEEISDFLKGMR